MHVELHERRIADDLEGVHLARLDDENVAGAGLEFDALYYIMAASLANELNLVVGMTMRARSFSRLTVEEKNGDAGVAVVRADEVVRAAAKRELVLTGSIHQGAKAPVPISVKGAALSPVASRTFTR